MTFSPSSAALGGLVLGGGRKLGGMIDKRVDGANMVHAVAIQGMFNAHHQQQEHQQHLKSIRAAYKMAPGGNFSVRTGGHEIHIGDATGTPSTKNTTTASTPDGGGHDSNGIRTPGTDHYENGVQHANGLMDTLQSRLQGIQGAGHSAAEDLTNAARGVKPQGALPMARPALPVGAKSTNTNPRGGRVTAGPNVQRVNGAIPMGGAKTVKGKKK